PQPSQLHAGIRPQDAPGQSDEANFELALNELDVATPFPMRERQNVLFRPVVVPGNDVDVLFEALRKAAQLADHPRNDLDAARKRLRALGADRVELDVERGRQIAHAIFDAARELGPWRPRARRGIVRTKAARQEL